MLDVFSVVAGFLGALIPLGLTVGRWAYRAAQRGGKSVRLLTGEDEFEGDGVIPRLRRVEQRSSRHERALVREGTLQTDGGPEVDDE